MRQVARVLLGCLCLAIAACRGDEARSTDAVVDCINGFDVAQVPAGSTVVLGAVALPTKQVLQTAASGDVARPLWAKQGLIVAIGKDFELRVADAWRGRLAFAWSQSVRDPVGSIRVPSCASRGGCPWLAFTGGYFVSEPACVAVVVSAGGDEQRVEIGIGAPCAGQAPAPTAPTPITSTGN
jgi:hypothetical protein